jgi:hypothetical protein
MYQQKANTTQLQAGKGPEAAVQEFYLPSGGTDPDFYLPADRGPAPGAFSRWIRRLPVVGWLRG